MVGTPVIIKHQDVTKENADKLRIGTISRAYFNEPDGWFYCEGIIWDDKAQDLIENKNWSVSCSYDFLGYNDEGGEENNIHYDKEFTELNFTHLAIVDNPRYERANIVFNSKDNEKGEWVTIKGNHIFIPDGKTLDEVIKEKGWGDKEKNKETSKDEDYKREADIALTMMAQDYEKRGNKGTVNRANELKEKLKNGEELTERDKAHIKMALDTYKPREHTKEAKQRKDKINELRETLKGIARKNEKDEQSISYVPIDPVSYGKEHTQYWGVDETGKTQYTTENKQKIYGVGLYKDYNGKEKLGFYIDYSDKPHWEVKKEPENLLSYYGEPNAMTPEQFDDVYKKVIKSLKKNKTDNSKEQDMVLLEELKKLICKVENEKENEMEVQNEAVDKRKLIDEVAGIMKSAGCDDKVIRTAIGKMEKIGYDKSETDGKTDNKKVKNEDDEKEKVKNEVEEKDDKKEEVKNETDEKEEKVDNEEEKDEKEVKEVKEEVKKDVDNKCKNEKPDTTSFDKINAIYNSVKQLKETKTYVSRQEKLDNAVEYFK